MGVRLALLVAAILALGQQPTPQPPSQSPERQVFRGGTQVVRVDAYPTRDGRVIEGLTADDFEVYEDGKRQPIANVDFVPFDALPDDDRSTFLSPREGLDLAADSRYRVIVFVIDREAFFGDQWPAMREPLMKFLQSEITPRDLLALITTDRSWKDLAIGKRLSEIQREIDSPEWIRPVQSEDRQVLLGCGMDDLKYRIRADESYAMLEGIVRLLGEVRDDRTAIVYLTNGLTRVGPDRRAAERKVLTMPNPIGLVNGRIQRVPKATSMHEQFCKTELRRLAETDFNRRFEDLITLSRAANVAFYPVAVPLVVPAFPQMEQDLRDYPVGAIPTRTLTGTNTSLGYLAAGTDGLMIAGTGDVLNGLRRVVQDATAHYLIGYYSTNTKADGKIRSIKVRLAKSGSAARARPFYRGPGKQDVKALADSSKPAAGPPQHVANALDVLSKSRPSAQFFSYAAISGSSLTVVVEVPPEAVQAGRWSEGATLEIIADAANGDTSGMGRGRLMSTGRAVVQFPITGPRPAKVMVRLRAEGESLVERSVLSEDDTHLVGDPLAYRSGPRGLAIPVGLFEFTHEEKMRLDWPVLAPIEDVDARILDKNGLPLKHRINVVMQEAADGAHAASELSLSPFARGDYVIELTVKAGAKTETKLLAFRMK